MHRRFLSLWKRLTSNLENLQLKRSTFRDCIFANISAASVDARCIEIYAMHERDSRRYYEPQNAEVSGYIYSKRTETVCSRG